MQSISKALHRKPCTFYKILKNKSPGYLFNLMSPRIMHYLLRNSDNIPCLNTKHICLNTKYYKISFHRL